MIGGVATAAGPVVGAVFYVGLGELLQIYALGLHLVVIGLLLIAIVLFLPAGLAPGLTALLPRPAFFRLKPVREG
jgi:branched-chain amino acid transport system permease protein